MLVADYLDARRERWRDLQWWTAQIDRACHETPDPTLRNLRISVAHWELGIAMRETIGPAAGANFHAWATWGSKKAGTTIRGEDVVGLSGIALRAVGRRPLRRAADRILGGNVTVLDDIGRVSAGYVAAFHGVGEDADATRLDTFLAGLRPGPAADGGQELLRDAFRAYDDARRAPTTDLGQERMLLANLTALLHEHVRLQPYIDGAMPRILRRTITRRLLDFTAGAETLRVGADVPRFWQPGSTVALHTISDPELREFLARWDRTIDDTAGSRAADWSAIADRMNYVCDLFRTRHFDVTLFAPPYDDDQLQAIDAGRIPRPPL